jgi:hypothetical protein
MREGIEVDEEVDEELAPVMERILRAHGGTCDTRDFYADSEFKAIVKRRLGVSGVRMPKPYTQSSRLSSKGETKQQRYRKRLVEKGCCPHCGKECTPYYECDDRRVKHALNGVLRTLVRQGRVEKTGNGMFRGVPSKS